MLPSSLPHTEVWHALYSDFVSLSLSLLVPASAQQTPCVALPAKPPVPTANISQSPNRAAITAARNSPDLAAKKLQFAQQIAKLDADPNVKALGIKNQQLINAVVNGSEHAKQKSQMAGQVAASQSNSAFQNQKAAFQASLKCIAP